MGDNDKLVGFALGFGLGFAACYLLVKSGTIAMSLESSKTQRKYNFMGNESGKGIAEHNPLANWKPLQNIPSVDRIGEFSPIPVTNIGTDGVKEISAGTRYQNDEKITVVRGPDKRILGYETKRDAKISDT
jgi:hypothetical protein